MTPSNWRTVRAGDAAEIVTGATPSRREPAYWAADGEPGHLWAAISDLRDRYVVRTAERITDAGIENSSVKLILPGTPVMSFKLTIGRTSVAAVPIYTNEAIAAFVPKQGVDAEYLRYVLPRAAASSTADVAIKGKTLNREKLVSLELPLPPLDEQRRIAATLQAVDDAVAAGEAVVAAVRSVRDAVLDRYCGPTEGAPSALTDLVTTITKGTTPTTYGHQYTDSGVPFVRVESITPDGALDLSDVKYISEDTHRVLARSQLQEGDVLFSIAGALGRTTTVPAGLAQANINQAVALIRIAEGRAVPAFVAYALRASEVRKQIAYLGAKQAQANLSLQQLGTLRISLPSVDRQREVVAALSAIDERLFAEYRTYDASVALKTALAEALLSGKLRVLAQDPA